MDLRGCRVLSEDFYLWSSAGLQSRLTSFFASKMLRGRVHKLGEQDYPLPLRHPDFRGHVYRLIDLVLGVVSEKPMLRLGDSQLAAMMSLFTVVITTILIRPKSMKGLT